jgi:choline dehydrogenase-like flavoprotein
VLFRLLGDRPASGHYLPARAPRCTDLVIQRACHKAGIRAIPARVAVLTRPMGSRPACHCCGQCDRGCREGAAFDTQRVFIQPAISYGNLTLITDGMARELLVDDSARVRAVSYVARDTREVREVSARTFVLAASACETARLLLNSGGARYPGGLSNSSGQVGRNLMDTVRVAKTAYVPALEDAPAHNRDGVGGLHLYCPWWLHGSSRRLDFARGNHIEFGGGRTMPFVGLFEDMTNKFDKFMITSSAVRERQLASPSMTATKTRTPLRSLRSRAAVSQLLCSR